MGNNSYFTEAEREEILDQLLTTLRADDRILGIVIVGSGAAGFEDEYSDIDLAIVVKEGVKVFEVFSEWKSKIEKMYQVLHCFETSYGEDSYLYGFWLWNYMELDLGFISLPALIAKRPKWHIAYDPTGLVQAKMESSTDGFSLPPLREIYERRLNSIWHYITHVIISVKRNQLWRAFHYLHEIRHRTIEVACIVRGLMVNSYRQVDMLPDELKEKLEMTLAQQLNEQTIMSQLSNLVELFFSEVRLVERELSIQKSDELKIHIDGLIQLFEEE